MAPSQPAAPAAQTPYFSGGRRLASPPLTAQLRGLLSTAYCFVGLYIATLLALDSTAAAASSSFAIQNRNAGPSGAFPKPRFFFFGGGGGGGGSDRRGPGGGGGGGGAGGAGKRLGTVDDVRGPECGSCPR